MEIESGGGRERKRGRRWQREREAHSIYEFCEGHKDTVLNRGELLASHICKKRSSCFYLFYFIFRERERKRKGEREGEKH